MGVYRNAGVEGELQEISRTMHHSHTRQRFKEPEWRRTPDNSLNHSIREQGKPLYIWLTAVLNIKPSKEQFLLLSFHF